MEIQELIAEARGGHFAPVFVLAGAERFLMERAVSLVRAACLGDGPAGFNDDLFHGSRLGADTALSAARTLPMMAPVRFVLVRDADEMAASELDRLCDYLLDPSPSTCLVLTATKLDGRTRFARTAKEQGALVAAEPLKDSAVRAFVLTECRARGHTLDRTAAEALADALGNDLSAIDDALERLSLFVGEGEPIGSDAVASCVTRIRTDSIWALVDAVSLRDQGRALAAAASLLGDREPPLRVLAMVARQLRMVAKMREALAAGLRGPEAARRAGAPPFKARDLTEAARRFSFSDLRDAFRTLADTDRALKGSRRPPGVVMEEAVLRLCAPRNAGAAQAR